MIGSGPFIFKKDEWKPGEKVVYVKNPKYKPRAEPPSGLAGGKVAKVDRVEWICDPRPADRRSTRCSNGEIDMIESAAARPAAAAGEGQEHQARRRSTRSGNQYVLRFNRLHKPFDNAKIRQAVLLRASTRRTSSRPTIGDPELLQGLQGDVRLRHAAGQTEAGMDGHARTGNVAKAKELLKEAGYDGTPVVLLHSTDLRCSPTSRRSPRRSSRAAGFKVDMQSMDWQTLVARRAKKDPPDKGGWNAFLTSWVAADILNPVMAGFFNASCDKAMFGWPCDERSRSCATPSPRRPIRPSRSRSPIDLQKYWVEHPTHVNLGQWYSADRACAPTSTA